MADLEKMQIKFWGVRGSVPCPGPNTVRYGGNTSCVEVWCGEDLLIFDAGTGLRGLGGSLAATKTVAWNLPEDARIELVRLHRMESVERKRAIGEPWRPGRNVSSVIGVSDAQATHKDGE